MAPTYFFQGPLPSAPRDLLPPTFPSNAVADLSHVCCCALMTANNCFFCMAPSIPPMGMCRKTGVPACISGNCVARILTAGRDRLDGIQEHHRNQPDDELHRTWQKPMRIYYSKLDVDTQSPKMARGRDQIVHKIAIATDSIVQKLFGAQHQTPERVSTDSAP